MSLRVFFSDPALEPGRQVALDPQESHYLVRVRRAQKGRAVEILDEHGGVWTGRIERADPKGALCRIEDGVPQPRPHRMLTLLLGLPAPKAAMEAISIAVELGVMRIMLARCDRTPADPPKTKRLQRVIRAAQRQCGRGSPPAIDGPMSLAGAIDSSSAISGFFAWTAHPHEASGPADVPGTVRLAVGPEGGFTPVEVDQMAAGGLRPLSLGPWTLRTETAVAAGSARLLWA